MGHSEVAANGKEPQLHRPGQIKHRVAMGKMGLEARMPEMINTDCNNQLLFPLINNNSN